MLKNLRMLKNLTPRLDNTRPTLGPIMQISEVVIYLGHRSGVG